MKDVTLLREEGQPDQEYSSNLSINLMSLLMILLSGREAGEASEGIPLG